MHISIVHSDCLRPQRLPAQNEAYSKLSRAIFFIEARLHCFLFLQLTVEEQKHFSSKAEEKCETIQEIL